MLAYYLIYKDSRILGYTTALSEADEICDFYRDLCWIFSKIKPKDISEITLDTINI